jgi:hypothetical protein
MDQLFGTSPGPAGYLMYDWYLDADGRLAYKNGLKAALAGLAKLAGVSAITAGSPG